MPPRRQRKCGEQQFPHGPWEFLDGPARTGPWQNRLRLQPAADGAVGVGERHPGHPGPLHFEGNGSQRGERVERSSAHVLRDGWRAADVGLLIL